MMDGAVPVSEFTQAIWHKIDTKTKPPGSLGRIEELAVQIAELQQSLTPRMDRCQLTIFAADHGIAHAGVSAFPQQVTRQMVLNFANGGAAANVFARTNGVDLRIVDTGVVGGPFDLEEVLGRRLGDGTANFTGQPAMPAESAETALEQGRALGQDGDWDAVAFGEMGIANTSSATLIAHKISGLPVAKLTGRGTGLDDEALRYKTDVLESAACRTGDLTPLETLAQYGGFEIATMAGAMLGAAGARRVIIVDGFIATSAALVALGLNPSIKPALVFAHRSDEAGHSILLNHLNASPLLDLGMRLGEGSGALLAWPLIKSAAAMLNEMASFEDADVTDGS
ncbi:nicotinate-nucleotide--dimethylbenzimidazole phosphoribosyltransferase [Qingshengfaniella alkalisoli]|uniref:Nicotinate-nucleotide--dimethylbenzimidazole phosphoribosyltransferase n=1 Tax=Qingshengfaniella alkalisoli TaxID=2599296 RepID=A0A5B8I9E2_9RHOB|nr:nicotinate-nucleotide--dimethylbenzimidazole phosphoribosyltransferase [Qingshengfaniella alkalisoli]QDY69556.1 nicotinate-nucleotide--dimethylbenzimidazole phosphoribosyltransferase [Qingshengfaniella alkalisoli]